MSYSPIRGRFMECDPIGYDDGMNRYQFVGSNPIRFVDPSGLARAIFGGAWGPASGWNQQFGPTIDNTNQQIAPAEPTEINGFADALNHYTLGSGAAMTYGSDILDLLSSTTAFHGAEDRSMNKIWGQVKAKAGAANKVGTSFYFDQIGFGSNIPTTSIPYWSPTLYLTINNYILSGMSDYTWTEACVRDAYGKEHTKFTITAKTDWAVKDCFTAKGWKNTIFNLIPGKGFWVTGKFTKNYTRDYYSADANRTYYWNVED